MQPFEVFVAHSCEEICQLLHVPERVLIAGGTDLIPQLRKGKNSVREVIDISHVQELKYIKKLENKIVIGALTTFSEMIDSSIVHVEAPLLWQAANQIGSPMTRSRATIGGNLAHASPAADSIPPLLCMDATIQLSSSKGDRIIPLEQFLLGPGLTALQSGEFIKSIIFTPLSQFFEYAYFKNGARKGMSIAITSLALALSIKNGKINDIRIGVGAAAPTAKRCIKAEEFLMGKVPSTEIWLEGACIAASEIAPIDDIRASKDYRRKSVESTLKSAFVEMSSGEKGRLHENH